MPDATTFAELFGGVFPAEAQVEEAVVYGPLGDDLLGTLRSETASQVEILEAIHANSAFGRGGTLKELIIRKSGEPVDGAAVWISTDFAGNNIVAGKLFTDSEGKVTFMLEAGITYYAWTQRAGVNFTNPIQISVP